MLLSGQQLCTLSINQSIGVNPNPKPSVQVAAAEGAAGFYRGFGAILAGVVPASAAYFGGYESGKLLVPAGAGVAGDMAVGVWAQLVAGVVFTPIDIVKERLQARRAKGGWL